MKILITGLSGAGKSSVIEALATLGHRAVDLDDDGWSIWLPCTANSTGAKPDHDWLWHERRLTDLLSGHTEGPLFLGGCAPNMGRFTPHFDRVVLLRACLDLLLDRVSRRTGNQYGKTAREARQIAANHDTVEPLLRRASTHEVDADRALEVVGADVLAIADTSEDARSGDGRCI